MFLYCICSFPVIYLKPGTNGGLAKTAAPWAFFLLVIQSISAKDRWFFDAKSFNPLTYIFLPVSEQHFMVLETCNSKLLRASMFDKGTKSAIQGVENCKVYS